MASATINLNAARGEAVTYNGTHVTSASDSTAVNITGWTIVATAKDENGTVVLTKSCTVTSGAAGTYTFSVAHADTLLKPATYQLDIQRTDSAAEKLMGYGTWRITPEVLY